MEFIDNGIVLKIGKFRETDLWVRLLTHKHGIITAFAFGGSKSRRRFSGCLDSFNYISARISSSKNGQFLNLQETTLLEQFKNLRTDFKMQGMAANCIHFVEALGVAADDSEKIFSLTKSMLNVLNGVDRLFPVASIEEQSKQGLSFDGQAACAVENGKQSSFVQAQADTQLVQANLFRKYPMLSMLPILFRMRIAAEQGYLLEPKFCPVCGRALDTNSVFLVSEGYFTCKTCKPLGSMGHSASKETLDILANIQEYSPEYWCLDFADTAILRELGKIIDSHIHYHVGLEWGEGRFRRSFA